MQIVTVANNVIAIVDVKIVDVKIVFAISTNAAKTANVTKIVNAARAANANAQIVIAKRTNFASV